MKLIHVFQTSNEKDIRDANVSHEFTKDGLGPSSSYWFRRKSTGRGEVPNYYRCSLSLSFATQSTLSKAEIEKLLRHGAYDIFNEEKVGEGEAASNAFVEEDIDSILQRHSRTVVHENTGSKSNIAGGTFSKASFKARSPDGKGKHRTEDVDIEDPDFWKKMIGEASFAEDDEVVSGKRQRTQANYSEDAYKKQLEQMLETSPGRMEVSSDHEDDEDTSEFRTGWNGPLPSHWMKEDVDRLVKGLSSFGYCISNWESFVQMVKLTKQYPIQEVSGAIL